ncbi:hypothetical protein [Lacimicrobium sp. SS2-24]|uniref:hypothetical protein n=1 Tax=Lacimicrobium sp. SS2-24 TaxID=2005569 RepID=UPI0011300642|nr:hypothetical protein [Lacimicrobium sp. SS2-24]
MNTEVLRVKARDFSAFYIQLWLFSLSQKAPDAGQQRPAMTPVYLSLPRRRESRALSGTPDARQHHPAMTSVYLSFPRRRESRALSGTPDARQHHPARTN